MSQLSSITEQYYHFVYTVQILKNVDIIGVRIKCNLHWTWNIRAQFTDLLTQHKSGFLIICQNKVDNIPYKLFETYLNVCHISVKYVLTFFTVTPKRDNFVLACINNVRSRGCCLRNIKFIILICVAYFSFIHPCFRWSSPLFSYKT